MVLSLTCVVLAAFVGATSLAACGTEAIGIDACRRVEEARCKRAQGCGIDLTSPPHTGAPGSDVEACVLYYRDACLHGLVRTAEPSAAEVNACVARIENGTCDATVTPALTSECAWLGTELGDAAVDSATPDAAGDAAAEASVQEAGVEKTDATNDASTD